MSSFSISKISSNYDYSSTQATNTTLESLGIPNEIIKKGPEAVKQYAREHYIDLSVLQPQQKSTTDAPTALKPASEHKDKKREIVNTLLNLGIPAAVITQGKEAVLAYAKENGITLPPPPKGSRLNLQG